MTGVHQLITLLVPVDKNYLADGPDGTFYIRTDITPEQTIDKDFMVKLGEHHGIAVQRAVEKKAKDK